MMEKDHYDLPDGNYVSLEGNVGLIYCPECNKENYTMNVSVGICTWCGLNGHMYYDKELKEIFE